MLVRSFLGERSEGDSLVGATIRALILRPGFLSSEFSSDRRASYASPLKLYIYASLVFFLVLSLRLEFKPALEAAGPALGPTEYPAPVTALRNELDRSGQHKIDGIMARDAVNRGILVGVASELPPDIYETLDNVDR